MRMTIRRAEPADATALAAFAEHCFRDAFGGVNTPENMDAYIATAYGPELQAAELADEAITTLVATDPEGGLTAYAQVRIRPEAPAAAGDRSIELWRFYVDRPFHGQGLAQELMAAVLDVAADLDRWVLWLAVWEQNFRGRAFYQKLGFVEAGTQDFTLGDDVQTDVVMVLEFEE